MRVLVVEDDKRLAGAVKRGLEAEGYAVDVALDGTDGKWMATEQEYDAIVLDIMLPGLNGYRVCQELREAGNWTPILMLTAKRGEYDEAEALDTGADDFLSKPFSFVVLLARLRALLRRGARERPAVLQVGDLRLDPAARRVWRGEQEVRLTTREFAVLEYLVRHAGDVVEKRQLLEHVWDFDFEGDPNIVEVYVGGSGARSTSRSGSAPSRPCVARAIGWIPMRERLSSVRFRTTAVATLVVAVALVVGAVAIVFLQRQSLLDGVERNIKARAGDVAALAHNGSLPQTLTAVKEDDLFTQVLDANGKVVSASGNLAGEPAITTRRPPRTGTDVLTLTVKPLGGEFRVATQRAQLGSTTVAVYSGEVLTDVNDATRELGIALAAGIPILLALVAIVTWLVVDARSDRSSGSARKSKRSATTSFSAGCPSLRPVTKSLDWLER